MAVDGLSPQIEGRVGRAVRGCRFLLVGHGFFTADLLAVFFVNAMKPLVEERAAVAARGELLAVVVRTRSDVPSWTAEVQQLLRSD